MVQGNKGRPVGSKKVKTIQWEALSYSIVEQHTRDFNEYLTSLWNGDDKQKELASNLILKLLEYFKPKQARIESIIRDEPLILFLKMPTTILYENDTLHYQDNRRYVYFVD